MSAPEAAAAPAMEASKVLRAVTLAAALLGLACAACAAWAEGWTYDEPYHIGWSKRLVEEGTTERRSTPLFNSKTPILVPNAVAKLVAEAAGVRRAQPVRFLSRLPTLGWLAATLAAVYFLGRRYLGGRAAALATIATALDPNWIAHGSLATPDVAYGLATVLAAFAGIAFARRPSWPRGAALGLALGFAFTAKFTAFLLLPGLLLIPLASPDPRGFLRRQGRRALAGLALAAAVGWLVVSSSYLFIGFGQPLSASRWRSPLMKAAATRYPGLRVPLPADFLTGIDMCVNHERGRDWPVMLFGRRHPGGVWYYFFVLWMLKTPVLLACAQAWGLLRAARDGMLVREPALRYLALTAGIALFYFSLLFRAQIGYRYVLMCLPLVSLLAAAGLAPLRFSGRVAGASAALLLVSSAEVLAYLGNPISFTNAAVWPKSQVYRLMNDSNLGWGQNRLKIVETLAARDLGGSHLDPVHLLEGHNTFDVNLLSGLVLPDRHRWVREHLKPGGHFDHTHVWFEVGHETYERFLNETRRDPAGGAAEALCPADAAYGEVRAGAPAELDAGGRADATIICVRTASLVDLGVRVADGAVVLGPARQPQGEWETIERLQVAWYRLEPGLHALASTTPKLVHAVWELRGGGVAVSVRPGMLDDDGFIHPRPGTG